MKRRIWAREQRGCLAFVGDTPIGWASVGPRQDYVRMDNSRVFRTPYDADAWSLPCLFIRKDWQRRGVSRLLVHHAVDVARRGGASHLLAYPVVSPKGPEHPIPSVFAFNGLPQVFLREGFRDVTPRGATRAVFLRRFRRKKA